MEELFDNITIDSDDQLEVDVAPASNNAGTETPESLENGNGGSQEPENSENKPDAEGLIEIQETGNSSLKDKGANTSLEEEVSEFKTNKRPLQKTETPEETSDNKNSSSSSSTPVVAFAKVLADEGVLSAFDEDVQKELEEKGVDGLIELMGREIQEGVEDYKSTLPQEIKDLIDNYEEGVPFDRILNVKSKQIELNNITEDALSTDKELQKNIVRQELEMRGYKDQEIEEMLIDFEDLAKLESKAKTSLGRLKQAYKEQQEEMKREVAEYNKQVEEKRKEQIATIQKTVFETEEIIPGVKLSKKEKEGIFKSMVTIVETSEDGRPMNAVMALRAKNPVEFEKRLHYFATLGFFDEKPNFSKLVATSKTQAVKELESTLERSTKFNTGTAGGFGAKGGAKEGLLKSLSQFQKD